MNEDYERAYWNQLGITIPHSKPKFYLEYEEISVEIPEEIIWDAKEYGKLAKKIHETVEGIKRENEFLVDDKIFPYRFKSASGYYKSIMVRFGTFIDKEGAEKIFDRFLFEAKLAHSDIRMGCYLAGMHIFDFEKQAIKVDVIGEVML